MLSIITGASIIYYVLIFGTTKPSQSASYKIRLHKTSRAWAVIIGRGNHTRINLGKIHPRSQCELELQQFVILKTSIITCKDIVNYFPSVVRRVVHRSSPTGTEFGTYRNNLISRRRSPITAHTDTTGRPGKGAHSGPRDTLKQLLKHDLI